MMAQQSVNETWFTDLPERFVDAGGNQTWVCQYHPSCGSNAPSNAFCAQCKRIRPDWNCLTCKRINQMAELECVACLRRNPFLKYPHKGGIVLVCNACLAPNSFGSSKCVNCFHEYLGPVPVQPKPGLTLSSVPSDVACLAVNEAAINAHQSQLGLVQNDGPPFTDAGFGPNVGPTSERIPEFLIEWCRPEDLSQEVSRPFVVMQSPSPSHCQQGAVGDCWLITAIAMVSTKRDLLAKLFVDTDAVRSFYVIKLWIDGTHRMIEVDDRIPCYKAMRTPVFAKIIDGHLFCALLEKAAAKAVGSYAKLDDGSVREGLAMLTGCPTEAHFITDEMRVDSNEYLKFWELLISWHQAGFLIGAGCGGQYENTRYLTAGLMPKHAYCILDVKVIDKGKTLLLRMRNPWGEHSWKGDYSDSWPNWPVGLKAELQANEEKKGIFWINFNDFFCYFDVLYVCQTVEALQEVRTRDLFLMPFARNDDIRLVVRETAIFDILIHHQGSRAHMHSRREFHGLLDLWILVVKMKPDGSVDKVVASSLRRIARFTGLSTMLEAGTTYNIIICAFNHWPNYDQIVANERVPAVSLSIQSPKSFDVEIRTEALSPTILGDALCHLARATGLVLQSDDDTNCIELLSHENASGSVLLVENKSSQPMAVDVFYKCRNKRTEMLREFDRRMVSTRRSLNTCDIIPPNHRQIINVVSVDDFFTGLFHRPEIHIEPYDLETFDEKSGRSYSIGPEMNRNVPAICAFNANLHAPHPI